MTAYILTGPEQCGVTVIGNAKKLLVHAPSTAVAKRIASKHVAGMSPAYWEGATVTEIAAASNWALWSARCQVISPDTGLAVVDVTGVAGPTTLDLIAAALVTALNATDLIANAAYNATTNVLTIAGTADALGDHQVQFDLITPDGGVMNTPLGSIVDGGSSGDALTIAFPADAYAIPAVTKRLKGV